MLDKISCILNSICVKILYRSNISFSGVLRIPFSTKIIAKKGTIKLKRVRALENGKIFADGGLISIGSNCFFNRNLIMVSKYAIEIGNHCVFGPNVCIYDHDHCFDTSCGITSDYKLGKIIIGDNCWVGAGAIILRGTSIGDGCIIGAGTVVKGIIPAHTIVTGKNRDLILKEIEKK